jgi:hypothetical protein
VASRKRTTVSTSGSGSWMSLLASTSLGLESANTVRAEVRADDTLADANYRLVVQTYAGDGNINARPLSSVQRAVTAQELRDGVQVRLLELGARSAKPLVIAWVETGAPDLEFDGRMARPRADSIVGRAHGTADVRIRLTSKRAA